MVKRMSTYTKAAPGAGVDAWGDPLPRSGSSIGPTDFAPVWVGPDGIRVAIRFRANRVAAVERMAKQIATERPELIFGWQCGGSRSATAYLRFRGWRLLPDDGR